LRPSKQFFYRTVKQWLSHRSYDVALDAASANFKNAAIIKAEKYIGVDLDAAFLKQGSGNHPNSIPLHADVRKLESHISPGSIDLCISTHTISHLNESDVSNFISSLVNLNKTGGDLLFNIDRESFNRLHLEILLRPHYEKVTIRRYRNVLSRAFESSAEDEIGMFESTDKVIYKILIKLLFYGEKLTTTAGIGDITLVMCRGSLNEQSNEFKFLK
jgi:hypothetical protein